MTEKQTDVVRITGARESLSDDMRSRQRRYLVSMGVRTVAFVAAVALLHGWARWTGVALAVVLPWVAVVGANITRGSSQPAPLRVDRPGQRALTTEPAPAARGPVVVSGAARPAQGHSTVPPTAPGPDGPVVLTTTRRT